MIQNPQIEAQQTALDEAWREHVQAIRALLIAQTRDLDLTDDLLHETYLQASKGFDSYRGGSIKAWLSTIARNTAFGHYRRSHVRLELPLDGREESAVVSNDLAIDVRRTVDALEPELRHALLLKHFGGYSYKEIAKRQDCPAGTAKWRVHQAIQKVRLALGDLTKQETVMSQEHLTGSDVLEILYRSNSKSKGGAHLRQCEQCRKLAKEYQETLEALDSAQSALRLVSLSDISADGTSVSYMFLNAPVDEPTSAFQCDLPEACPARFFLLDGVELEYKQSTMDDRPGVIYYDVQLPRQLNTDETLDLMICVTGARTDRCENGEMRGAFTLNLGNDNEWLGIMQVHIPPELKITRAEPRPSVKPSATGQTITWKQIIPKGASFDGELVVAPR